MNKLIQQCGIPLAIYSDRHPVFKFTGDTSRYPAGPTQFAPGNGGVGNPADLRRIAPGLGACLRSLRAPVWAKWRDAKRNSNWMRYDIRLSGTLLTPMSSWTNEVKAFGTTSETSSKGRVERAAGTFQDRLVCELRLAGSATIAEANEVLDNFIPRFNERFGVQAEQDCPAYRRL